MALSHTCEKCGHSSTVPNRYAGKEHKCPKCGATFVPIVVPSPSSSPILFGLLSAAAWLGGGAILNKAQSAVHEIEAFVLFLIGALFAVGAALLHHIDATRRTLIEQSGQLRRSLDGQKEG